jgi:hypothetical protein
MTAPSAGSHGPRSASRLSEPDQNPRLVDARGMLTGLRVRITKPTYSEPGKLWQAAAIDPIKVTKPDGTESIIGSICGETEIRFVRFLFLIVRGNSARLRAIPKSVSNLSSLHRSNMSNPPTLF